VVIAALSLSVPQVLVDLEGLLKLVPVLLAAAEKASAECGWSAPDVPNVSNTPREN
jgi:hypothetical protein